MTSQTSKRTGSTTFETVQFRPEQTNSKSALTSNAVMRTSGPFLSINTAKDEHFINKVITLLNGVLAKK